MEINYVGEQLIWGHIGHFFVVLSFSAALMATVSYFLSEKNKTESASWKKLGRISFYLHATGVLGIIATMFYLLLNHRFEYHYVWQHSNTEMQMKYILSCFWEGQEGSFLLWTFWHVVLGFFLMYKSREWEASTMAIFSIVQVFLASMLLGVYFGDFRLGSNPFILLREHPDMINMPFTRVANYLESLDGRGLNPLLQNYWMTIHPPTLFLGFAATLLPFVYAIAAIWRKQYHQWIKPALPWAFFGVMILGLGILMGGAWAYESLSFGGFWAWDPVENASLVPWLTLVAGAHVMLINRNKPQSLLSAFFLIYISFILILYSTFLTRSGVLGETSVHAFTDLGMSGQLLVYLLFFIWLPIALVYEKIKWKNAVIIATILVIVFNVIFGFNKLLNLAFILTSTIVAFTVLSKKLPNQQKEDELSSREFWMFIGSLILLIAAFQIIFSTSTPVINKILRGGIADFFASLNNVLPNALFEKISQANMATPKDVIAHYNAWQVPFAIVISLIMAFGQYLKYKKTNMADFWKKMSLSTVLSLVMGIVFISLLKLREPLLIILLFTSLFAFIANADYFVRVAKGKLKGNAASVAHVGFALILLGSLISTGKKEFISRNQSNFDLGKDFPNEENILLSRNDTVRMGDYQVTYRGDSISGINIYYNVDYFKTNKEGKLEKAFTLNPFIQTNPRMGNVAEPSTKHYLHKDIFTNVTYAEIKDPNQTEEDEWEAPVDYQMKRGDTVFTNNSLIILQDFVAAKEADINDLSLGAKLKVMTITGKEYSAMPLYAIKNGSLVPTEDFIEALEMEVLFWKFDPKEEIASLRVREKKNADNDFIIMKAMIFPWINILWIGCIIMVIGTGMAVYQRIYRKAKTVIT
jgi:cytochrome c-type biogenesis protein CcmF